MARDKSGDGDHEGAITFHCHHQHNHHFHVHHLHTLTLEWVVGIGGSSHASWCVWHGNHCHFNTTFATHTTVTVIGGTAKQLLGSSTDWCATTIVTPHTRGATSTHTHTWMAKWCGVANVLRLLCASTLAWSLHFATPFVCVTSSAKCVSPSIPSPLCFSITHPFLVCVCGIVKWHSRSLCGC